MKTNTLLIWLLLLSSFLSWGQSIKTDSLSQSEINKLKFIVGKWEGTGWMTGRDGQTHTFQQTENIQFKIDNTAILIEGQGKSNGHITHNALAIVSFNKEDNNYTFQSYLSTGRRGSFKAELIKDKFYWYPNENMRYIININDKGQWYEIGEMKKNQDWSKFFEMTLDKKED